MKDLLGGSRSFILLIACVLYFLVVLPINKLHERFAPHQDVQADQRDCPECLSPVPARARRCGFCTSELTPLPAAADAERTRAQARRTGRLRGPVQAGGVTAGHRVPGPAPRGRGEGDG